MRIWLQMILGAGFRAVATLARRLRRGPRRPGWTLRFELAVAVVRWAVTCGVQGAPAVLRRCFRGLTPPRALRRRVGRAPAPWVGPGAQTFTPLGWGQAAPTILFFPGGGYVFGSPHTHRDLLTRLADTAGARVVAVDYRKAPEHPLPAAIDDGEAAYRAMLAAGTPAHLLFVGGDSAGGGLALAVVLRARQTGLALPRGLLLLSPWTDLECAGESVRRNDDADYLTLPALRRIAAWYLGGGDVQDPRASVVRADLRGLPPLYIQTGGAEVLLSDNQVLAARACAAGVDVTHDVMEEMVHVFSAFIALQPQPAATALHRLGDFVRRWAAAAPGASEPAPHGRP